MRKKLTDLEKCKREIESILKKYNCDITTDDPYDPISLYDKDTDKDITIR